MNKKILIVDDDPRNIFALKLTLKSRGYQIESSTMAQEAIEILQKDDKINIVLMDMMMPEMDGYEATKYIRRMGAEKAGIPIVAMTAHTIQGELEKCLAIGMNDYVSKPFSSDELNLKIQHLVGSKHKDEKSVLK